MTREEQRKIQQTALNTHGIIKHAIAKSKRDRAGKDEIITELADVSIIVEQMAFFYGEEYFNKEKERKLLRLKERLQKHIPKQMELPQRGDIVRITKIADIAKLHKAKLREGDLCEVISSWACPCDNGESVKYVRIKYPNGKRKRMPIRSYIYEWEIVEEQQ